MKRKYLAWMPMWLKRPLIWVLTPVLSALGRNRVEDDIRDILRKGGFTETKPGYWEAPVEPD